MTYRIATGAQRAAFPMRPNGPRTLKAALLARTSVLARPGTLKRDQVGAIHAHFIRGPQSLRPKMIATGIQTISVAPPSQLSGMDDFRVVADPGLGFSLKPPKFIRKAAATVVKAVKDTAKEVKHLATIKNIGIAAGALLAAPVVLPALAAGAGAVGGALAHGASALLTAGKVGGGFVAKTVSKIFSHPGIQTYPNPEGPPWDPGIGTPPTTPPPPSTDTAAAGGGAAPTLPADGGVASSGGYSGGYSGGSASGGLSTPTTGDETAAEPAQAGTPGGMSPLLIGAVAVGGALLLSSALKRRGR